MERETGVGKLGWYGNSTGFDRKNIFFPILRNERKKKDYLTSLEKFKFKFFN